MRNNIRRSLMVAAAASGIWALSTAGASAAELPVPSDAGSAVGGTVESAEKAGEDGRGTVADTVRRATDTVKETTGAAEDVTGEVREEVPTHGIPENGLPTNTLPTGGLPTGAADGVTGKLRGTDALDADEAVQGAKGAAGQAFDSTGHASKAIKEAQKDVRSAAHWLRVAPVASGSPVVPAVPHVPAAPAVSGHLPSHTLPALAVPGVPSVPGVPAVPALPAVPAVPAAGVPADALPAAEALPASPLRPERLTGELEGRHAEESVSKIRNTVAHAHPVIDNVSGTVPAARPVELRARAAAYQLTVDAARTVDCALATTAPFAESTYHRTEALGHDATGDLGTFAHGAASDSAAYAHALAGTGVHGNVDRLAAHTVTNAWSLVTATTKRDLTDPADFPGAPVASQTPAGP